MADGEQQKLSDIVKRLHGRLRRQLREADGDHKSVWENHLTDTKCLQEYASAMCTLAVNHWTKQAPQGRVEWCHKTANEFFRGGGLEKLMEKQKRRLQFAEEADECCCCFVPTEESKVCSHAVYPTVTDTLLLLDVGSCFNPFAVYKDVQPVAVDLQPADSSVFKCDFLNVKVEELTSSRQDSSSETSINKSVLTVGLPLKENSNFGEVSVFSNQKLLQESRTADSLKNNKSTSNHGNTCSYLRLPDLLRKDGSRTFNMEEYFKSGHEVKTLPAEIFHVVVFSLLLSYFPSAVQRWECCLKAHKLLLTNGLLLIVAPDSSHQNRHAAMMKSWKTGIESMGFVRWKYVKMTHLHCIAFRKVAPCHFCDHNNGTPDMLYIPQDFQEDEEEFETLPHSKADDSEIMECFSELPDMGV